MHSFSIAALFALATSVVTAAPALELEARTYPTVATYEAEMTSVDADFLESLKSVVVRLDEDVSSETAVEARQSGTCGIQGSVHPV